MKTRNKPSLTHTSLIALIACVISIDSASAEIRAGGKVSISFDSKADKSKFVDVRGIDPDNSNLGSALSSKKGIGESGCLVCTNIGNDNKNNDVAVYYAPGGLKSAEGKIILNAGQTLSMGLDFKVIDPKSQATPRLGLVSSKGLLKRTQGGTEIDVKGGKDTLGGAILDGIGVCLSGLQKDLNIINSKPGNKVFAKDANGPYTLKENAWYQFILNIYKTPTSGQFDVSITLNELNQSGKVTQRIGQHASTLMNPRFYSDTKTGALAGFTFINNAKGLTSTKEYDNFHIEIQKGNQVGNVLVKHVKPTRKKGKMQTPTYSTLIGIGDISIIIPK